MSFAGMAFKTETQATLRPGETATLKGPDGHVYSFTHLGVSQYNTMNRQVTAVLLDVGRDGKPIGRMRTEKRQHVDALGNPTFEPSTEVGIMSGLRVDLYVVLAGLVNGTEQAVFRFTINPLVWWVWFGGFVLVIGGLIVSTFATLTILPSIYAILQRGARVTSASLNPMDPESRYYAGK